MSLMKVELTNILHESMRIDKKKAAELVDLFFEELKEGLVKDGAVHLSGFGKFRIKQKRPRRGRNPHTGKDLTIDARKVVGFQHSMVLKRRLNSGKG